MSFIWHDQLAYRFEGNTGLLAAADTPCANGGLVRFWENIADPEADPKVYVEQPTQARRPQWFSNGRGGNGFIRCRFSQQQHFNDLPITQPAGTGAGDINPYTVFAVVDQVRLANFPALLGSTATNGGKMGLYFRPFRDQNIHLGKNFRVGNIVFPMVYFGTFGRSASGLTTSPAGRLWHRVNGFNVFADDFQSTGVTTTEITSTQFLRNTALDSDGFFDGHLYEFLFYNGVLSNETIFAIENYLLTKYAIPV